MKEEGSISLTIKCEECGRDRKMLYLECPLATQSNFSFHNSFICKCKKEIKFKCDFKTSKIIPDKV